MKMRGLCVLIAVAGIVVLLCGLSVPAFGDATYYWTPGGKSYHSRSTCPSLSKSRVIRSGTLSQAYAAGKTDPCNNCVHGSSESEEPAYEEPPYVEVTSVSLGPNAIVADLGDTIPLRATVAPSNATNPSVSWYLGDGSVGSLQSDGQQAMYVASSVGTAWVYASSFSGGVTAVCKITVREPVAGGSSMYRMYNPNSGEHFYTASRDERNGIFSAGWQYEGLGWTAPSSSYTPVFRLYNPYAGDHHYTTSASERDHLVSVGWNYEGVGWYSDDNMGQPLYRQYNPYATTGTHNYTTSQAERDNLVSVGWHDEGIGWYGMRD